MKFFLHIISLSAALLSLWLSPAYGADNGLDKSLNSNAKEALQGEIENNVSQASLSEITNTDAGTQESLDTNNALIWPVFPNESLNQIARMFYPKSTSMQKRFVLKTIALNPNLSPSFTPDSPFEKPDLLTVPSLKSLAVKVATKRSNKTKKPNNSILKISYDIQETIGQETRFLLDAYDEVFNKNLFLKAQLTELIKKIGFLETRLVGLKLTFDKTMQLSNSESNPISKSINKRKVFVNNTPKVNANVVDASPSNTTHQASFVDQYAINIMQVLSILGVLLLINHLLKQYRQREFAKFAQLEPDLFERTIEIKNDTQKLEPKNNEPKVNEPKNNELATLPTINLQQQVAEDKLSHDAQAIIASSLQEAKLLVSINRKQDAVTHLKSTIETYPKQSIDHWLYLLEIFKKLNAKDDFEHYAKQLHNALNVMTPVWYESQASIYVPQHLEEFPHIIQNLQSKWPGALATDYLRDLITDNRQGERVGFGKNVLSEILMLIQLLDNR